MKKSKNVIFAFRALIIPSRNYQGWDARLLPFALNRATRFISPTKTLEHMAAERPLVSTPIADVAESYADIVHPGATPAEFIRACGQALHCSGKNARGAPRKCARCWPAPRGTPRGDHGATHRADHRRQAQYPGGCAFTCEISYSPHKPLPCNGTALIQRCIEDCHRIGFLRDDDPIRTAHQVDLPYAYVIYDHARRRNVATLRAWLAQHGIILAGRYSEWEYYNSDHAFIAGKKAAGEVRALQQASIPQTSA